MVKDLIGFGADVNAADDKQRSMLHYLAQSTDEARLRGALKIVDLLIEEEACASAQDVDGNTPLHLAVLPSIRLGEEQKKSHRPSWDYGGPKTFMDVMLKHKSDVNLRNKDGVSPFELLISQTANDTSCHYIKNFLDAGADISSPATSGNTVFYDFLANFAKEGLFKFGSNKAILAFLQRGADPQTLLPSGQPLIREIFHHKHYLPPWKFMDILSMLKGVDLNAAQDYENSIGHDLATYIRKQHETAKYFPNRLAEKLFVTDIKLNNRNKKGQTPFLLLVSFTSSPNELIQLITRCLKAGADLLAEDHLGICPLLCMTRWKTKMPYLDDLLKIYLQGRSKDRTVTLDSTSHPRRVEPEGQRVYWEDWELAADATDWATAREIFFHPKNRSRVDVNEKLRKSILIALADKHVGLVSEAFAKAADSSIEKEALRRELARIFQDLRTVGREIPVPWVDKLLELC